MTLKPLDFSFAPMSALSARPPYAVPEAEWLPELSEELASRERVYPVQVRDKRMKADEAERHIAILGAIREDLLERAFYDNPAWQPGTRFVRHHPAIHYDAKVRELRRELAIRRNRWPGQISAKRMDADVARLRMERLEAVHWLYWVNLFGADDVFNERAHDKAECASLIRAWTWRRDNWLRERADAGDPAVPADASTAARDAHRAKHPEWRAQAEQLDALYLAAAQRHGFVPLDAAA
jgi:hypothetical protein